MNSIAMSRKSLLGHALALIGTVVFCASALAGGQPGPRIPDDNFDRNGAFGGDEEFKGHPRPPKRPQIPKNNFEWKGTFRGNEKFKGNNEDLSAPQVSEELIVRGKWQNGYFNL